LGAVHAVRTSKKFAKEQTTEQELEKQTVDNGDGRVQSAGVVSGIVIRIAIDHPHEAGSAHDGGVSRNARKLVVQRLPTQKSKRTD
jgi:hypothetical protein